MATLRVAKNKPCTLSQGFKANPGLKLANTFGVHLSPLRSKLGTIEVVHYVVFFKRAPVDVGNLLQNRASVKTLIVRQHYDSQTRPCLRVDSIVPPNHSSGSASDITAPGQPLASMEFGAAFKTAGHFSSRLSDFSALEHQVPAGAVVDDLVTGLYRRPH